MIKKILTNRWFLIGVGFLLLGLLIWFVGPLLGIADARPLSSVAARLIFIAVIVLIWGAAQLYKYWRARRASKRLMEGMSEQAPDSSGVNAAADVAMLRAGVDQAISTLKKQGGGRKWGKEYLYQVPWYMFIGAPGSGKTTALINCGLRFPVASGGQVHAVKGVGGTRNCDWWFTDDAVFLDTAGRYTTQDSDKKADSAAWLGFLGLLKKFRARHPLNGVIVTVSVSDLLTQSEQERDGYALAVRQRIQELHQRLDVDFPIYLMVTKTDLLAGFSEFFSNFGADERAQVFGGTFAYRDIVAGDFDYSSSFLAQFKETERRLNARLLDRMQQERDMLRRALAYSFTQQFSSVGPLLSRFIEQAFGKSRYEMKSLLRGVYFTSGTQEGTPIDRVIGALSRMLKIDRNVLPPMRASSGKSFFLMKLLKEVVFPEAGLVSFNVSRERKRKQLFLGAYIGLAVIAVSLAGVWMLSYFKNEAMIRDIQGKVALLAKASKNLPQPAADDLVDVLPLLNQLRDVPFGYGDRNASTAMSMHFGLFQGDRIGEVATDTYLRTLRSVFLPRVAMLLEEQIRNSQQSEIKYEALKAYLMLFDDKHLEVEALSAFLAAYWEQIAYRGGSDTQTDFISHLRASLENRPVSIDWSRDDSLVASARIALATTSLAERAYSRIRLLGPPSSVQPVKLSDMLGPSGAQIFERLGAVPLSSPLPAIFTYAGFHEGFSTMVEGVVEQMAAEDVWVLGEEYSSSAGGNNKANLLEAVKHRYLEEYIRHWDAVLSGIRLRNPASLSDTLMYVRILSAADSPLRKLLVGVAKEVSLSSAGKTSAIKEGLENKMLDSAKQMASKLFSGAPSMLPERSKNRPLESMVDDHFEQLRRLVGSAATGQPAPLDQILGLLSEFYQELSAYEAGGYRAAEVRPLASAVRVRSEADRLPVPASQILKSLIASTTGQAAAVNRSNMQKAIEGAASFCDKAISGRYPVSRLSANDIMLADFNSVFSPGGELDSFFNSNLRQSVDISGAVWRLKPGVEEASPISFADLRQFQNADSIRRSFFRGATTASIAGELRLISSEWPQVTLEYGGEVHQFTPNGPAWAVRWPASGAGAKLYATAPAQGIVTEGDWAIFRLIDKAHSDTASPERLRLTFMLEGRKAAIFELRANSVLNPFKLKELGGFQCPGKK